MKEVWKQIPKYPNYSVSNHGRVKNIATEYIRKTAISKAGYPRTSLRNPDTGKMMAQTIHRLVAKAFLIPDPLRNTVNHIDGVKTNNCVDNLEWSTIAENVQHGYDTGLTRIKFGSESPNSKLTERQVKLIKKMIKTKKQKDVAGLFGVCKQTISHINVGLVWSQV